MRDGGFRWLVTVLSSAACGVPLAAQSFQALPHRPSVTVARASAQLPPTPFPEGCAAIDHIVLHYDPDAMAEWLPTCRDLLRSLPPAVRVSIAVHGQAEADHLARALALEAPAIRDRPCTLVVGRPVTSWARDRYVAIRDGDRSAFLTPRIDRVDPEYLGDLAGAHASAAPSARCFPTGYSFEGGDVACNGTHAFIGWKTVTDNLENGMTDDIEAAFARMFGCPLVVVGRPAPPHEHLDMFMTVVDERTVLLGDPVLGLELLGREPADNVPDFDAWTQVALHSGLLARYECVLNELERQGLTVRRLPIVHGEDGNVLTWNNAVIERRADGRRAYMPAYGLPELDEVAARAFREVGVAVLPIDVAAIAPSGGTVRCLTNVIAWSWPGPSAAVVPGD